MTSLSAKSAGPKFFLPLYMAISLFKRHSENNMGRGEEAFNQSSLLYTFQSYYLCRLHYFQFETVRTFVK